MFGCVVYLHINDNYRNKLNEKSHVRIIMGYFDELRTYHLCDLLKKNLIINVIFHDNILGTKLLKSSCGLLHIDSFHIFEECQLGVPFFEDSTKQLNSTPRLTGS